MRTAALLAAIAMLVVVPIAGAADVDAGRAKAAGCAGCHGANGEGNGPNPPLAGMPADRFVQAMKDYKSGKRPNPMMKALAAKIDDSETANLAAYYASLKRK